MEKIRSHSFVGDQYFHSQKLESDLKRRAVRAAGVTIVSQVANTCIRMISTVILARLLTPHDFGLVAMVTSVYVFFQMFRNLGLNEAIIQREEINHKQISTLFWINVAFCFGITLIFIALAPLIAWFYKEPQLKSISIIISLEFIFGGLSTQHLALLKRKMQFFGPSVNEIIAAIISIMVAITLAWKGWGYWALVARNLTVAMATAVGAWILCGWRPSLPAFGSGVGPMLKFGINNLGTYTVSYFSQNLDKILIGWRNSAQSLAYYDRAYQLFMMPASQLSWPLHHVAVSTLSRLRNDPEKYRRYYLNAVSILAFIGMPVSAILTVTGKDVILLLLGPQWPKAAEIFSVFGLGIGIMVLWYTHGWLHVSLGRPDRWFLWTVVNSVVTIVSFLIGLPFGPLGVAIAYTASLYVLIGPCLWYAGRPINLRLSSVVLATWKCFLSALGAGLLCWFVIYSFDLTSNIFLRLNIFVRLFSSFMLCISVYLILIVALYQNTKPISQFISAFRDMVPGLRSQPM